jgi:hypothetical protein
MCRAPWATRVMVAICALGAARVGDARGDAPDGAVAVGGGNGDLDRAAVGAAALAAVREAGWSVAHEPLTGPDATRLLECGDTARPSSCVPLSVTSRGIQRVLVLAIEHRRADNGAPMVVLTGRLIVRAPPTLVVGQRFCEHCADDRLTAASRQLARRLLRELAVRAGRTVLEVASTPPGARITLDGQPIGVTDATFNTFPGTHRVVVERAGHRAETRTVISEEGKTAAVAVTLVPLTGREHPRRSTRVLGGALFAGGLITAVVGGALLELGARGGRDDRYIYVGATPAGAALAGAGVVAMAAGIHVWRRAAAASPVLAFTESGGVVAGWFAEF